MGVICLTSAELLILSELGHRICLGLGVFWGLRLFFQFFIYSKKLWKGKGFESVAHIVFSYFGFILPPCFWLLGSIALTM
jgi:hypothetical protein